MQNQNKYILNIDDRPKGREGIEEMLERMEKIEEPLDDEPTDLKNKETA